MIVNLRGTHGSGKSTVVKKIMEHYGYTIHKDEVRRRGGARPLVYRVNAPALKGSALFIVGPYETACGGCDAVQPYDRIWPLVDGYGALGNHVLFEGALISSSYGNIGRSSEAYGGNFVFAFLDTPLKLCLQRIRARRAARGNTKPLDPTNTEFKFNSVAKSIPKIRDEFGRRVVIVDHREPVRAVMKLFGVNLRKEP